MSVLAKRIANLPPEKRALLSLRLKKNRELADQPPKIPRRQEPESYPLSFAQRRLWFLDQLEPGSPLYIIPAAIRLNGPLDAAALRRSLQAVVQRHETLRANFIELEGEPVQIIRPHVALAVPLIDLQNLSPDRQEDEIRRLAESEAQRPFNLSQDSLLRATLLKLGVAEHLLLLTVHHIVFDGWSTGVFLREMGILYEAGRNGRSLSLPDLPIQYADYAHWQRGQLETEALQSQLNYWQRQLGQDPPFLDLPTDHPRPATQTHHGLHYNCELPLSLFQKVTEIAREEDATPFMALLAAFHVLLHRYTNQNRIHIGIPIANRKRSEIEGLIGFFVNTLVIQAGFDDESTFRQMLRQVRNTALDAYANQDIPFEMLVEALQPDRNTSHTPLFQVMFDLQKAPLTDVQIDDVTLSLQPQETAIAKFDLLLIISEGPDRVTAEFEYNTDLFDPATIERLAGHFRVLLDGMVANPDQPIATLSLLTESERRQLLVAWNDTAVPYPTDQCVHRLVESQAEQTPEATAVVFGQEIITYGELNGRANQLAHHLQKLGVGPETVVGVCLERSADLIIALLAVLKTGAAYAPMDPTYPPERLAFMLADAQSPVVLTHSHIAPRLAQKSSRLLCLDTAEPTLAHETAANPPARTQTHNLAYIIYTSGSTGQPKGVQIEHRGLLNLVFWHRRKFTVTAADRATQIAGPGFDASVWEIWPYLCAGASIYIPDDETRASPPQLRDWLLAHNITIAFLPTPLAENVMALEWPNESVLRIILTGGDRLHRFPSSQHPFALINNYGPTEDTVVTTSGLVPAQKQSIIPPTIGRPIDNTQLYLLDKWLQPVPIGVPGELHIGGDGLARGYLNQPELTAAKFIENPFAPESGAKLYKTGDLARYRPDGEVEFLGRIDDQVKIRGFRIELGEIQAALNQHPHISESVVTVHGEQSSDKFLTAYVVSQTLSLAVRDVREFLKNKLPDYMIPAACIVLEALPLTANGKVDRRALPPPDSIQSDREFVAPRSTTEELLAGIWSQLLGVERVGIYDNFFASGGHSLLATQLVSRIRSSFQVDLPLRTLFEAPTIAELAAQLSTSEAAKAPPIQPLPPGQQAPLSFAQQRLWFLDHLEPGSPLYMMADAIRLTGPLNVTALERTVQAVALRHETLRTVFPATHDGQPTLRVYPELTIPLPVVDLRPFPPDQQKQEIQRLITAEAQRPFDLSRGPLLRTTLLKLDETEHIILVSLHHIIADGWSVGVLTKEIVALYEAFANAQPSPLADLPIQYSDFAFWQRQWLTGDTLTKQLDYWREQLTGAPALLELPTDRPRPAVQSFRGAKRPFTLPQDLSQSLHQLSRQENVTLFMTLLAAFQVLLHRYTGQTDICVGVPIANRNRRDIEGLIGFFVNTLVMRNNPSPGLAFRDLLHRTRQTTLNAFANQDIPFEMVVDAVQPERNLSHSPLFQVMFVLQNMPAHPLELPGLALTSLDVDCGISNFDLTLVLTETAGGLTGNFEYNTDLFDATTIQRLIGHFQTLLTGIVADPDRAIDQLPILTEAERQVLQEWNDTGAALPDNQCIHHLIAAQAAQTPTAVALQIGSKQITYEALNQQANRLAHALIQRGVAPGDCVGIALDRSAELIIGLLGILKAGAAFLPLDPTYPAERLAFMIGDAQPKTILTREAISHSQFTFRQALDQTTHDSQIIMLSPDWNDFAQHPTTNPIIPQSSNDLAYVIYTSGSTGTPKGVMVSHGGVLNHNLAVIDLFHLQSLDRVWQFATINFDTAVEEIFPTLICGATLVLRDETVPPVHQLNDLVAEQQLTALDLPTAYWHEWVNELAHTSQPVPDCLRLVVVGGEKASAAHLQKWQSVVDATAVTWLNTYGPTEATIIATAYRPDGPLSGEIPIGRPIANTQTYILDAQQQPVPIGVPGELYIGGVGVALGYLGQPELTAERFIPNPVIEQSKGPREQGRKGEITPSPMLYRTGDLVRWMPNGNLEYLGRVDDQVKIRGFRIEPGEIETVLRQHPQVQETAVLAREDPPGRQRVVAYIVPVEASPTITDLRQFLQTHLPAYMIPAAFVTLDRLPLMPNGKIDREALPSPDPQRPKLASEFAPPQTGKEHKMVEIWQALLGVAPIGIHDNFFELGGDSILSIQVVARARQVGLQLTPKQLFQNPTIAGLAAAAETIPIIQAEQGIVTGEVPLTPIQRWFFEQTFPDPHHWNQSVMLEVGEELDMALLETAVSHLLRHHDALRMRYQPTDSGWQQMNDAEETTAVVQHRNLTNLPERAQREMLATAANALQASLNLEHGPLIRLLYFRLGPERPDYLLIVIHHLVIDGVSWRILLEDLQLVYQQLRQNQPALLPDKTTSFQQWARELTAYAQSEAAQEELVYWQKMAERERPFPLPRDYPQNTNDNLVKNARNIIVNLNREETEALLRDVPSVYGTEINHILLAALVETFSRHTGRRSLWIALEGHGREDILPGVDLSHTVGWFTALFPVCLDLQAARTPGDAIKQTKEQLNAIPHHGIGFGILRYLSQDDQIRTALQNLPEPEISFNYLGQFDQSVSDLKFSLSRENTGSPLNPDAQRPYLLDISGGISGGRLQFEWIYGAHMHKAGAIQNLADGFIDALRTLIAHCQNPEAGGHTPSDFPDADLSEDDLEALLLEVGD